LIVRDGIPPQVRLHSAETLDVPDVLRFYWRGAGKAGCAVDEPRRRLGAGGRDVMRTGFADRKRRGVRRRSENTADELAERAVVFLVHAGTLRRAVRLNVGSDRRGHGIASRIGVDDADGARQHRLNKRGDENPATDKWRNAPAH